MKRIKSLIIIITIMAIPIIVYAIPEKPPGEVSLGEGNMIDASNITFNGVTTFEKDTIASKKKYSSTEAGRNALLVLGGSNSIEDCTIEKSGDSNSEKDDFYGTNAAVLTKDGTLSIVGGKITTNGAHANAVFAYDKGAINLLETKVDTSKNNSGGLMVTGGGIISANKCTVKTSGNSSAAIRSDRGGGTLIVKNGTYQTDGIGSPAIYSTANIEVNKAELTSTKSEGVVIEGSNTVLLNKTKLVDTNTELNGQSETYKNIFIYQSMSGDASEGIGEFTARNSDIVTNKGDTFFVTNTMATINLENNTITNNDGALLRIQKGKWGNEGSNGGIATLSMVKQEATGDVILDELSEVSIYLSNKSVLTGAINNNQKANIAILSLDKDSILSLTADTYINSLSNKDEKNTNIYSNGKYKLYVGGEEVKINSGSYTKSEKTTTTKDINNYVGIIIGGLLLVISIIIIVIALKKIIFMNNKKN